MHGFSANIEKDIVENTNFRKVLYTSNYSPAHHKDGIVRATKQEAESNEAEFDGVTTE